MIFQLVIHHTLVVIYLTEEMRSFIFGRDDLLLVSCVGIGTCARRWRRGRQRLRIIPRVVNNGHWHVALMILI